MIDSRHDMEPFFGPQLPLYPGVSQVVRSYGSALPGNVYTAWLQQFAPPLTLRDRVAVYLWEPNQIKLQSGYYDARLVGSYLELPLLVTWCCPLSPGIPGVSASSISSVTAGSCSRCPSSPTNWLVTLAGLTAGLAGLNGSWALTHDGDCSWATFPLLKSLALSIVEPGPIWSFVGSDSTTSGYFQYSFPFATAQCLGPLTLALVQAVGGTAPATVTLTAG